VRGSKRETWILSNKPTRLIDFDDAKALVVERKLFEVVRQRCCGRRTGAELIEPIEVASDYGPAASSRLRRLSDAAEVSRACFIDRALTIVPFASLMYTFSVGIYGHAGTALE